jgi:hypothetical protein
MTPPHRSGRNCTRIAKKELSLQHLADVIGFLRDSLGPAADIAM